MTGPGGEMFDDSNISFFHNRRYSIQYSLTQQAWEWKITKNLNFSGDTLFLAVRTICEDYIELIPGGYRNNLHPKSYKRLLKLLVFSFKIHNWFKDWSPER